MSENQKADLGQQSHPAPSDGSSIDPRTISIERPPESNQPESPAATCLSEIQDKQTTSDSSLAGDSQPLPEITSTTISLPTTLQNDNEVIARLAAMNPLEYDRVRGEQAKLMGCRASVLDDMVKAARNGKGEEKRLPFPEVEPHSGPINPAQLFDEVSDIISSHVVLDKVQADAAALWVAHTYLVDSVDTSPIAIINAPEKACAKTLLQDLLGRMSFRPLSASNASLSALFRAAELWKPTIFIDEADTFFREHPEIHGMVNAGYKRGGSVLRSESVGDSFEPRMFSVYCPKSIAGIALEKHLPDSTMSRGIVLNLRRKLPHESITRLRNTDRAKFEVIASKLTRFANDYSQQVRLARPHLPEKLSDRAQDNWEPLLAIAECGGPEWVQRAVESALNISGASEESVSTGNELLADIKHIFETGKGVTKISTVDLIRDLVADEEMTWATYNRGKQLSPRQLSKQLGFYGIKSKTVRFGYATPKGYEYSQFADAFARYLAPPEDLPQPCNILPESNAGVALRVSDAGSVAATEPTHATPGPMPLLDCGDVSNESPISGGTTEVQLVTNLEDLF